MRWKKLGLVYRPTGQLWWAREYAHLPTPIVRDSRTIRVYYSGLDEHRYGRIGYIDVDSSDPTRVVGVSQEPVLEIGNPGTFDDSGVTPSCVVRVGVSTYLYYTGWQRCERVPYMLFTGLATIGADGVCQRMSSVPILDRTESEPLLRSTPFVIREGSVSRAWYCSAQCWTTVNDAHYPTYVVRSAESTDGIHWSSGGPVCVGHASRDEYGIARPCVVRDADVYRMWYSVRSRTVPYRIGYAESLDGQTWQRHDDRAGIVRSPEGWDSEMICYPSVIDVHGQRFMFYNGNRHGASGIGVAVLEG